MTSILRTIRPHRIQLIRITSPIQTRFIKMQAPLTKGLGPQDHAAIGKAAQLPGKPTGQYASIAPITLPSAGRAVELQMRITVPLVGSNLPIILLSHGHGPSNNLSSLNGYAPTAQFYAAHGFVVIQPTHLSSIALGLSKDTPGAPMFWQARCQDMTTILDRLSELEDSVPLLKGRLDHSRIVVWGHSMGSHTAAALLGTHVTDQDKTHTDLRDPRIKLGLLLGAIGGGGALKEAIKTSYPVLAGTDHSHISTPTLVVAGDEDESTHLNTRGWKWHTEPFEQGPGAKDMVVFRHGKHSFGGISGFDSSDCSFAKEESPEMCAATLRATVAYMRSKLYEGDASWAEMSKALEETGLGHVETK